MIRKYFGTDGIRGLANEYPMTGEMALRLGAAVGRYFRRDTKEHRVVIGKDTRRSGYMLETALMSGFMSTGMNVFPVGPLPTPAVGMLTRSMRADVGVMISASHNSYRDNGIKFFGPDGFKLSDVAELEIENLLDNKINLSQPENIGRARRIDDGLGRYIEFVKTTFSSRKLLDGLRIVVDCANGAAYKAAPTVLWELGAEVITVAANPDGFNINRGCGSTLPDLAMRRVIETKSDVGICLDGDGDRVTLITELGDAIDGDQLMGFIAREWAQANRLAHNTMVATVMSNMGLERYLSGIGIGLVRSDVGDRYVVEKMRQAGYNFGGEQSGHIIMMDYVTTGDGLIAGLQFLQAMIKTDRRASELLRVFDPLPQKLENVRYNGVNPLQSATVVAAIESGWDRFGDCGRLVIRRSGTESLIRVMGECEDSKILHEVVSDIAHAVQAVTVQ